MDSDFVYVHGKHPSEIYVKRVSKIVSFGNQQSLSISFNTKKKIILYLHTKPEETNYLLLDEDVFLPISANDLMIGRT